MIKKTYIIETNSFNKLKFADAGNVFIHIGNNSFMNITMIDKDNNSLLATCLKDNVLLTSYINDQYDKVNIRSQENINSNDL